MIRTENNRELIAYGEKMEMNSVETIEEPGQILMALLE